jgi:hypothetical protein
MKNRPGTLSAPVLQARQRLFACGYVPGPPACLPAHVVQIDRACYRSMRCARCNRRGQRYEVYHRGRGYVGLLVCLCGHCEEV